MLTDVGNKKKVSLVLEDSKRVAWKYTKIIKMQCLHSLGDRYKEQW